MSEQQKYWFAARTRDKQEFAIRDSLEKLKTELDLNYYLPTQFVIRQLKYRRKRVEVPVIKNLIFIQATKQDACDISNKYNIQLFYMKDLLTRAMLIVPDKQMQDFIFVMDLDPNGVSFDNDHLSVGSRVQVVKGDFCGVEGELASEANKGTSSHMRNALELSIITAPCFVMVSANSFDVPPPKRLKLLMVYPAPITQSCDDDSFI